MCHIQYIMGAVRKAKLGDKGSSSKYDGLAAFEADVRLTFNNAMEYNKVAHDSDRESIGYTVRGTVDVR